MNKVTIRFTEKDAARALKTWAKSKNYALLNISNYTHWDYAEPPFYSVQAVVVMESSVKHCGFHIHQSGDICLIPLETETSTSEAPI